MRKYYKQHYNVSHPDAKHQLRCEATCMCEKGPCNLSMLYPNPSLLRSKNDVAKHELREQVAANVRMPPHPLLLQSIQYAAKHQAHEQVT